MATTQTWIDTPLTRCSAAALLLEEIIHLAGDVEAYGNMWTGGEMGELAAAIREATAEYNRI